MKNDLFHKLLSLYKGSEGDPVKSRVSFPTFWNGKEWASATECHHFILIPSDKSFRIPPPEFTPYDIGRIMPELYDGFEVKVRRMQEAIDKIKVVDEEITKPCDDCDGDGSFKFGRHEYECKNCDGYGEQGSGEYQKVKDDATLIRIGICDFSNSLISTLIQACRLLKSEVIRCRFQSPAKASIFELKGGILVGIMPRIDNDPDKIIHCGK